MAAKRGAPRRAGQPRSGQSGSGRARSGQSRTGGRRDSGRSAGGGGVRGSRDRVTRDRAPRDRAPRDRVTKERGLGGDQLEGRQAVREALIARRRKVFEIWIANDIDQSEIIEDITELALANRVQVHDVPRRKLEDRARSEAPQGVIAFAAELEETPLAELLATRDGTKPFLVAIDGVNDPGNFGALLRCCEGAGVTGVVVPKHRSVHVTPTVVKAAAGAVEYVPMALVPGLPAAITEMKKNKVWVVGLDDSAEHSLFDIGTLADDPVCVVLGAEGAGLSRLVRERCDMVVSIPMHGSLSSLNVSAAAALATYEVVRARRSGA